MAIFKTVLYQKKSKKILQTLLLFFKFFELVF